MVNLKSALTDQKDPILQYVTSEVSLGVKVKS